MHQPIRFVVVGCGTIAPTHVRALLALPDQAQIVGCCDSDPVRAESFAREFGLVCTDFESALNDPNVDAISVCVPSGLHAECGVRALRAGKHVVIEKPMEVSVAACQELLSAERDSGCKLTIISQHRFDPATSQVRRAVDEGKLGKLVLGEMRVPWYRTQEYYDSGGWRGTWALDGGGCLMNQGIHTLDLMLWLAGPVTSVRALARTSAHERIEVEDVLVANLTFANGAIGTLLATTSAYPGFPAYLALHGTQGSAIIEGDEMHTLAIKGQTSLHGNGGTAHARQVAMGGTLSATANSVPLPPTDENTTGSWVWGDAHRAQFLDFIESIQMDRAPLVTGEAGLKAVEVVTAIYASAQSDQIVFL